MPGRDVGGSGTRAVIFARASQAWTIARVELRRVLFARRGLWVYALALLPCVLFFAHGVDARMRSNALGRRGVTAANLMDSVREGESLAAIRERVGKPAEERWSQRSRFVRQHTPTAGTTTHVIEPAVEARFVRLNVTVPSYSGEPSARIYEFEVYSPEGAANLALKRPVTGSLPCRPERGRRRR